MRPQTHLETARRFLGLREKPGAQHDRFIQWCFTLCGLSADTPDETPWCSAWVHGIAFLHGLPMSGSAAARSWLKVGYGVSYEEALPGDVVILKRGGGEQPGPEVTSGAPGHVGFLVGFKAGGGVLVLGGNQGDAVSVAEFPVDRILGIRVIS